MVMFLLRGQGAGLGPVQHYGPGSCPGASQDGDPPTLERK